MHIHFIITGGTFDGALKEKGVAPSTTVIGSYLEEAIEPEFSYSMDVPFLKDSRDITAEDRARVVELVQQSSSERIVVTHGTFTLVETASVLLQELPQLKKRVLVTGAMIPFDETRSDAPFNLGFACAAAMFAPEGIWVAMHGNLWAPDRVRKNLELNRFESL